MTDFHRINAFSDITEEHCDELSFLWLLRSKAVKRENSDWHTVNRLERRMSKHLAGLRLNKGASLALALQRLEERPESGECFTATILALLSKESSTVEHLLTVATANDNAFSGFISAFGWLDKTIVNDWIRKWLFSADANEKYCAIAICSIHRADPGQELTQIMRNRESYNHPQLYCRAMRLATELNRADLSHQIAHVAHYSQEQENDAISFWAARASILLGNKQLANSLKNWVLAPNPHQHDAIEIAFRTVDNHQARNWIKSLASHEEQQRQSIFAIAALGDPQPVAWLIQHMAQPMLARIAGYAFTMITGIDLESHHLCLDTPPKGWDDLLQAIEEDDSDKGTAALEHIENDSFLVWPDHKKISQLWQTRQHEFTPTQRYLLGERLTPHHLTNILNHGKQHHRRAAAIEQTLLSNTALVSVSALTVGVLNA